MLLLNKYALLLICILSSFIVFAQFDSSDEQFYLEINKYRKNEKNYKQKQIDSIFYHNFTHNNYKKIRTFIDSIKTIGILQRSLYSEITIPYFIAYAENNYIEAYKKFTEKEYQQSETLAYNSVFYIKSSYHNNKNDIDLINKVLSNLKRNYNVNQFFVKVTKIRILSKIMFAKKVMNDTTNNRTLQNRHSYAFSSTDDAFYHIDRNKNEKEIFDLLNRYRSLFFKNLYYKIQHHKYDKDENYYNLIKLCKYTYKSEKNKQNIDKSINLLKEYVVVLTKDNKYNDAYSFISSLEELSKLSSYLKENININELYKTLSNICINNNEYSWANKFSSKNNEIEKKDNYRTITYQENKNIKDYEYQDNRKPNFLARKENNQNKTVINENTNNEFVDSEKKKAFKEYVKNQENFIAKKVASKIYYKATGKSGYPNVSILDSTIDDDKFKISIKVSWEETATLSIMQLLRTIGGGKTKCWVKGDVIVDLTSKNEIKFRQTDRNDNYDRRTSWTRNGDVIIGAIATIGYASWESVKWAGKNGYLGDGTFRNNANKPCYQIINKSNPNPINGMIKYTIKCKNGKNEIITYYPNKGEYSTTLLSPAFHKNLTFEDAIKDYCKCN